MDDESSVSVSLFRPCAAGWNGGRREAQVSVQRLGKGRCRKFRQDGFSSGDGSAEKSFGAFEKRCSERRFFLRLSVLEPEKAVIRRSANRIDGCRAIIIFTFAAANKMQHQKFCAALIL